MSTYQELENEFKEKVKHLQEKICKHPFTEWMEQFYDFRETGYKVLICEMCQKELDRKLKYD